MQSIFYQKIKKNRKYVKIVILGLGFRGEVTDSRLSPTSIKVAR